VIGYHPVSLHYDQPQLGEPFYARIDTALKHIDQYLNLNDDGPVVYEVMSRAAGIWPKADR